MLTMHLVVFLLCTAATLAVQAKQESRACSPLDIVIARGTTEAQGYGTLGGGSQFVNAVKKAVPGTTAYAVKYPASFGPSSPDIGVKDTLRYLEMRSKECPQQRYVLSGYSQGGVVMHRAAVKMDKAFLKSKVVAAVTFGDGGQLATKEKPIYNSPVGPIPLWPSELNGRIKFNCVPGDPVCAGTGTVISHISYSAGDYSQKSADFVKEQWEIMKGSGERMIFKL